MSLFAMGRLGLRQAIYVVCAVAGLLYSLIGFADRSPVQKEAIVLHDVARNRQIPIQMYWPPGLDCAAKTQCGVVLLSPGYGLKHTEYGFIAEPLARAGKVVFAIQHDLPSDPPLARKGDLITIRTPMWQRGAQNLSYARKALGKIYPNLQWHKLTLIGHSNGGDISALASTQHPHLASVLITLDNRRYPLPRSSLIKVLSIRSSDFPADPGVLPNSAKEQGDAC